jgi:hypothetical protein
MKTAPATQSVLDALANRLTHSDGFDPFDHLTRVLAGIGMAPQDSGGKIEFIGRDPIIPSVFRIASAAGTTVSFVTLRNCRRRCFWRQPLPSLPISTLAESAPTKRKGRHEGALCLPAG